MSDIREGRTARIVTAMADSMTAHRAVAERSVDRPSWDDRSLQKADKAVVDYWLAQLWRAPEDPSRGELADAFARRWTDTQDGAVITVSRVWPGWQTDNLANAWADIRSALAGYRWDPDDVLTQAGGREFRQEHRPAFGPIETGYQSERVVALRETVAVRDQQVGLIVRTAWDGSCGPALEIVTHERNRPAAERLMAAFVARVAAANIYRGQQLTVQGGRIKFTRIEPAAFEDVIVPADLLTRVRAGTVDMLAQREALARHGMGCGHAVVLSGKPGCHARGQGIMLYDGSTKKVEDIVVGDELLGPDSKPRHVLELARGRDVMVEIRPIKGQSFVVNIDHVLSLKKSKRHIPGEDIIDVTVREWLSWSSTEKSRYKLFRASVDFISETRRSVVLPVDPYFLGVLLGDGSMERCVAVTKPDPEIKLLVQEQAAIWGLRVRTSNGTRCPTHFLATEKGHHNVLLDALRALGVAVGGGHRFVPKTYLHGTRHARIEVLSGLLDTDGSVTTGGYDFISKSGQLAADVVFLARSLGLAAYKHECQKGCQNGFVGTYHRVSISGDGSVLRCRIPRKRITNERKQKKNVLHTGFDANILKEDDFFGFALDGDGRFLLDDFTVTHNTGKTMLARAVATELAGRVTAWVVSAKAFYGASSVADFYDMVRAFGPALVVFEDIDLIGKSRAAFAGQENDVLGELLTQWSGTQDNRDILTVASTNRFADLDEALVDRPERVGMRVEVGLPGPDERGRLLRAMAARYRTTVELTPAGWRSIVQATDGFTGDWIRATVGSAVRTAIARAPDVPVTLDEPALQGAVASMLRERTAMRRDDPLPGGRPIVRT